MSFNNNAYSVRIRLITTLEALRVWTEYFQCYVQQNCASISVRPCWMCTVAIVNSVVRSRFSTGESVP